MELTVTLDCDALPHESIRVASVSEGISTPPTARLTISSRTVIDAEAALGTPAVVGFSRGDAKRTFHLVVTGVAVVDADAGDTIYEIELTHELALLRFRRDSRIFQDKTAKDIAVDVFTRAGISASHVSWSVKRTLATRTYTAQYRETDFDFVARLFEDEGIYWFANDDESAPKTVITDATTTCTAIAPDSSVPFANEGGGQGVHELAIDHALVTEAVALTDWNFETPGLDLTSRTKLVDAPRSEKFEHAAGYATPDDGKALAKIRAEELSSASVAVRGTSSHPGFRAGAWFELTSAAPNAPVGKYLLRSVNHQIAGGSYGNAFAGAPLDLPYRTARTTPRPAVLGAHSATVTGASGEEIHTDRFGRMKGKLAFDRSTIKDDKASCWMRVVQPPIGGSMMLARVGWEMAVRYLDGDPDRPVAVGRLYDGAHVAPESLPAAQPTTSFQTVSSPRAEKVNAIVVNDKSGGMLFSLLAAKDLDGTVNHDWVETIGADDARQVGTDCTTIIEKKQSITVKKDDSTKVTGDAGVAVGKDRTKKITADETSKIEGNASVKIAGDDTEKVGADRTSSATKDLIENVNGAFAAKVGGAVTTHATKDYVIYVAGNSKESVAGPKTVTSSDGALTEAVVGDATLTVGGACMETVTGKRLASAQGASTLKIGGVGTLTAAGKLQIKASTIKITITGAATLMGGGGVVALTPASATFAGLLTFDGSGGVKITGAPNLAG